MFFYNIDKNKIMNFLKKWYIYISIIVIYIPLVFLVLLSFTGSSDRGNISDNFDNMNGNNYLDIFVNSDFLNSFFNSLFVAIIVTPVSIIIAIITSLGIWGSNSKIKKVFLNFTKFDIAIPDIITGVTLFILFTFVWISLGQNLGYITVVISHISFCTPYAIMVIYPRMSKFNGNLISASMDLGATKFKTYMKIVIPYLKPVIITSFVLVTTLSFDDFIITSLVNGNFSTIGTAIFESNKGIKAWIVTFGAILIMVFIFFTMLYLLKITYKNKRKLNEKN